VTFLLILVLQLFSIPALGTPQMAIFDHDPTPQDLNSYASVYSPRGYHEIDLQPLILHTLGIYIWNTGESFSLAGWEAELVGWASDDPDLFISTSRVFPSSQAVDVNSDTRRFSVGLGDCITQPADTPLKLAEIDIFFTNDFVAGSLILRTKTPGRPQLSQCDATVIGIEAESNALLANASKLNGQPYDPQRVANPRLSPLFPATSLEVAAGVGTVLSVQSPIYGTYGLRDHSLAEVDVTFPILNQALGVYEYITEGVVYPESPNDQLQYNPSGSTVLRPDSHIVFVASRLPEGFQRIFGLSHDRPFFISYVRHLTLPTDDLNQEVYGTAHFEMPYMKAKPGTDNQVDMQYLSQTLEPEGKTLGAIIDEITSFYSQGGN